MVLCMLALLLLLALATYDIDDPGFSSTGGPGRVANWIGPIGAWLADVFVTAGFLPPGQALYPGWPAVMLAMVCDYLPFMILPLYASVEKVDWSLIEAAEDLGASPFRAFWHAVMPQIRPGMIAGSVLVFLPATGQFVIPDLLGGAKVALLGNAVQQQFGASRDWPFGSAIAVAALLVMIVSLWLHTRVTKGRREVALP